MRTLLIVLLMGLMGFGFSIPVEAKEKKESFISVMDVKISSTQKVRNIYFQIGGNGQYEPYDWWCYSSKARYQSESYVNIAFVLWFRPSLMVDKDTICTTKVSEIDKWIYGPLKARPILSGYEHFQHLAHFTQFDFARVYPTPSKPIWCKANNLGLYHETRTAYYHKAIWKLSDDASLWVYVSRDVKCTSDIKVYYNWLRNPWWRFVPTYP